MSVRPRGCTLGKESCMCRVSQHGLAFSLIADPSESLWIEIRRERDQAVVVSAPIAGRVRKKRRWLDR